MTTEKTQYRCGQLNCSRLIWKSLGVLLLAGIIPVHAHGQNTTRLVAPKAHPWATSTTSKTETKVSGTVQEVKSQRGVGRMVVSGANGEVAVDLGPATGKAAKSLAAGDHIEVAGWMRTANGKNVLVARQITAGERQVVVRNKNGILVHPAPATSKRPQRVGASFAGGAR